MSAQASAERLVEAESKFLDAKARLLALLRPDVSPNHKKQEPSILQQLPQLPTRPRQFAKMESSDQKMDAHNLTFNDPPSIPPGISSPTSQVNQWRHMSTGHRDAAPVQPGAISQAANANPDFANYSVDTLEQIATMTDELEPQFFDSIRHRSQQLDGSQTKPPPIDYSPVRGSTGRSSDPSPTKVRSRRDQAYSRTTTMQAFDGTRYKDMTSMPKQGSAHRHSKGRLARSKDKDGKRGATRSKRSSGFDLSLGPAYSKENRKMREDRLAATDEAILYQRKLRQNLARQAALSSEPVRRAFRSQTAAAGKMVLAGGRALHSVPAAQDFSG